MRPKLEAADRDCGFVPHAFPEQVVDLGEIRMNYAVAGGPELPPLLLVPGQTESWWGYERLMRLLEDRFRVYAVDLRGQGRSTWTPGRYTLDNFGNDLVRFIDLVVARPVVVSGNSSGGVLAAWLTAYAKPGQVLAAALEDPPLFASELDPPVGPGIAGGIGPLFEHWHTWLGDQWSRGDWEGARLSLPTGLPPELLRGLAVMEPPSEDTGAAAPQNLREYDPEWGRAFVSGTVSAGVEHERMLSSVGAPILLTHHVRQLDPVSGRLLGALSDEQAARARELVERAGQQVSYRSFPDAPHALHRSHPGRFARALTDWYARLRP
ncbi:alpha/beta fold hydrolase [Promicromonospora sp. NPDC057488]|uniref:alpha/beta fold hydrolase n=1 Tax=Promicromonospora sp. NPDC057488 TaxID=3346147 RepID=UPI00366A8697